MKENFSGLRGKTGRLDRLGMLMSFCFLLLLVRGFGGLGYSAVMDDWFLYFGTSTYDNIWSEYIIPNDKLSIRPLAGLLDCFVIAPLSDYIGYIQLALTVMLIAALWMLWTLFRDRKLQVGGIFLIFLSLAPMSFEAVYWLSAATRIIPALFFTALACKQAMCYIKTRQTVYFILFYIFGICSMGFYEAAVPVYIILALMLITGERSKPEVRALAVSLLMQTAVLAVYYFIHSATKEIATRGQLSSFALIFEHFPETAEGIWKLYTVYLPWLFSRAWTNGLELLKGSAPYFIPVILMAGVFGFFAARNHARTNSRIIYTFFTGLFVFLGGIAVYFVLDNIRLPIRITYLPTVGILLMAESILGLLLFGKSGKFIYGVLCAVAAFVCVVAGIGEIEQYRRVSRSDIEVAANIFNSGLVNDMLDENHYMWLFNTPEYYFPEELCYYEHIRSAVQTEAALTNCLMYYTGEYRINTIQPVDDGCFARLYIPGEEETFYFAGLEDDLSVTRLTLAGEEGLYYELLREDGSIFGTLGFDSATGGYLFRKT